MVFSRIIPTRVGTSDIADSGRTEKKDHPHACGDKGNAFLFIKSREGSSPRVWGQGANGSTGETVKRIIPTRVGTSLYTFVPSSTIQDHPHACGDKQSIFLFRVLVLGSSPRVWGQAHQVQRKGLQYRIIPTRVGTSSIFSERISRSEDHPHACGDK